MTTRAPQPVASAPYPTRLLAELFAGPAARARSTPTGTSRAIALPPPPTGRHLLARTGLTQFPPDARWDAPSFTTVTPWTCRLDDVAVHGDGGILVVDGAIVRDTLAHCEPGRQWFHQAEDHVILYGAAAPVPLSGTWLSLLGGGHWNYYHWMFDGIGRLAGVEADILAACTGVLLPAEPTAVAAETVARSGIARAREVRRVAPWDSFVVETLVVPWSMAALYQPHPRLVSWLAALVPAAPLGRRRRIWIDRRGAANRALLNESEVVAALARFGVEPVALEGRSLGDQAALFADAELVVAPHGAGLANLVFAPRDCRVVELLSDAYANWCFRYLAAASGLDYDCVLGRALPGDGSVHARPWTVATTHVQAAVAAALER